MIAINNESQNNASDWQTAFVDMLPEIKKMAPPCLLSPRPRGPRGCDRRRHRPLLIGLRAFARARPNGSRYCLESGLV